MSSEILRRDPCAGALESTNSDYEQEKGDIQKNRK